jgi:hypothetical protein
LAFIHIPPGCKAVRGVTGLPSAFK